MVMISIYVCKRMGRFGILKELFEFRDAVIRILIVGRKIET